MRVQTLAPEETLALKNDGALEVFFIGCGSAGAKKLRQTNFLLIKGESHVMVDFGRTGPDALRENARLKPGETVILLGENKKEKAEFVRVVSGEGEGASVIEVRLSNKK